MSDERTREPQYQIQVIRRGMNNPTPLPSDEPRRWLFWSVLVEGDDLHG